MKRTEAKCSGLILLAEPQADSGRRKRIADYRHAHPDADRWARSQRGIPHTIETQDRVFRMAEQVLNVRDSLTAVQFFHVLRALDDAARWETGPNGLPRPSSASAMGLVGYKVLFGKLPPVRGHDWPADCELTDDAESELATFGLIAQGYEPVVFDGTDPAAYIWALFEIDERKAANADSCGPDRRLARPRGLAVVKAPEPRHLPKPIPRSRSLEMAAAGR